MENTVNKVFGIIPARYASSRFPGKPLARIGEKSMIQCVYDNVASSCLDGVAVATDDERIFAHVDGFGGNVVMTSDKHRSGTDRCCEAAKHFFPDGNDIVVNIQGDEPLVSENEITLLAKAFADPAVQIATLVNPSTDPSVLIDHNSVKVVADKFGNALYFSRAPIPFRRDKSDKPMEFLRHVGVYAYRYNTLKAITNLESSPLEDCERLEQLRWLENGFKIRVLRCNYQGIGIDTPEDLQIFIDKRNNKL